MKDLIIGIIIGALVTIGIFTYVNLYRGLIKIEVRMERNEIDMEKIIQKVGPLPEKWKGGKR